MDYNIPAAYNDIMEFARLAIKNDGYSLSHAGATLSASKHKNENAWTVSLTTNEDFVVKRVEVDGEKGLFDEIVDVLESHVKVS